MTKYRTLGPGDGITGPTGLEYRNLTNDMIPAEAYYVPEDFVWTGDLSPVADRTLVISYDHNVSGNITLPAGCILLFDGGKLSSVGTITGNNSRIINPRSLPCFDATVVFAGTWSETICNYQWFGAKSNASLATYSNECSAAINKAHNSPFKVQPLPGFYYISNTLIFNTAKYLDFGISSAKHDDDPSMPEAQVIPSQVCFYTDQDIDVWDLRMSGINIFGGQINVAGVGTYNKDCIKIKAQTAKIIDGRIVGTKIVGSMSGNAALGASGKAFHWDTSENTQYGCLANMTIDLHVLFIPYGIYFDPPSDFHSTWCGVNNITIIADGCKQGIYAASGFNTYKGYTQTRAVLAYEEQDMYQAEFSSNNEIEIDCWDLTARDYAPYPGMYYPSRGMLINAAGCTVITNTSVVYNNYYTSKPSRFVNNYSDIRLLAERSNSSVFISELHNNLIELNRIAPCIVKYHSGASIDFDSLTPSIGSEPEITSIYSEYIENLFSGKGFVPAIKYRTSSDPDKDFVEISFISGVPYHYGGNVHFALEGMTPKRIQFIGMKSTGNPVIVDIFPDTPSGTYANRRYSRPFQAGTYNAYAIRFIGSQNNPKEVTISQGSPAVVTLNNHSMSGIINFATTGTLPYPLLPDTNYYIVNATQNTFNVSLTSGGEAIETTTVGSGVHTVSYVGSMYIKDIALESDLRLNGSNYTRKVDDYRFKYAALLTQAGESVPIITEKLNTTGVSPSFNAYSTPGDYSFVCSNRVTTKNDILDITLNIYQGTTFIGTVWILRTSDSIYRIRTYNPSGELANGILTNFLFTFNTAW